MIILPKFFPVFKTLYVNLIHIKNLIFGGKNMNDDCCVEIDSIDMIETLASNIDMIDMMLLTQSLTAGKNNILLVDSRDTTFHLKKLCYDSSFAVPGYDLTDKFKNMMRSGINCVYILEHEKMNELALYFINHGISVGIIKDVDNKSILRMNKKEIERNISKETISYYKYQYLQWCKETNFVDYPHILEERIRELFKMLNFAGIENNEMEKTNFDRWLTEMLQLTNQYYELAIYPLVKWCVVNQLSNHTNI
jgi:hypothetical protein